MVLMLKNIYRWLSQGIGGGTHGQILENNRLKRENKQLKQLIGQLLFEKEKGKKINMVRSLNIKVNKTKLAKDLGISRSSFYYNRKRDEIDSEVRRQIEAVMVEHKAYGHKRIAIELKMGHNRIRRIMKKYNLKPYRRRAKLPFKKKDIGKPATNIPNLVQSLLDNKLIIKPYQVWCTDFTYIKYQGKFIYLATIIDLFT